jgi:hypothetical protein
MKPLFFLTLSLLAFLFGSFASAVDFPIQMPKTSSSFLFEQSVNKQSGFSVNQEDPALKDLFGASTDTNGNTILASELCGPTTVANMMASLQFSNPKLTTTFQPAAGNYVQQVREYTSSCQTDKKNGTKIIHLRQCILDGLNQSGFANADVSVIGPDSLLAPAPAPEYQKVLKTVDIEDVKKAVLQNDGVILEIKWYQFNEKTLTWETNSGHYILVVGFDYDPSFGDNRLILKIINPEVDYMQRKDPLQRFDSIEMIKIPSKPGMKYPGGTAYILDGALFRGVTKRAFVRYLIVSKLNPAL